MQKKTRDSNIELLRVITMLMIVAYHFVYHCIVDKISAQGLLGASMMNLKLLFLQVVYTFGNIGNNIFVLISGYFLANNVIGGVKQTRLLKPAQS